MNCPKCMDDMVSAKATNFGDEYWYCRNCKKELKEIEAEVPPSVELTPTFYEPQLPPVGLGGVITQQIPTGLKAIIPQPASAALSIFPHDFFYSNFLCTSVCKKCGYMGYNMFGCTP